MARSFKIAPPYSLIDVSGVWRQECVGFHQESVAGKYSTLTRSRSFAGGTISPIEVSPVRSGMNKDFGVVTKCFGSNRYSISFPAFTLMKFLLSSSFLNFGRPDPFWIFFFVRLQSPITVSLLGSLFRPSPLDPI